MFYEMLVADMRGKGFYLNSYEPRVANKIIVGKKITVCWNMGNLQVSHVDPEEVTKFMEWKEGIYGEVRITRGKLHKYTGTTIDLRTPGELWATMVE